MTRPRADQNWKEGQEKKRQEICVQRHKISLDMGSEEER